MQFEMIRHNWPEIAGFDLDKPLGRAHYVFVHFLTPVEFKLREEWLSLNAGDLIVVEPHVPHRIVSRQPLLNDWMHVYGDIGEQMARFGLQVNTVYHMEQKQQITSRIARPGCDPHAGGKGEDIAPAGAFGDGNLGAAGL